MDVTYDPTAQAAELSKAQEYKGYLELAARANALMDAVYKNRTEAKRADPWICPAKHRSVQAKDGGPEIRFFNFHPKCVARLSYAEALLLGNWCLATIAEEDAEYLRQREAKVVAARGQLKMVHDAHKESLIGNTANANAIKAIETEEERKLKEENVELKARLDKIEKMLGQAAAPAPTVAAKTK